MKGEPGRYCGEVLKRERIGDLKCYFVQSDEPEFRYHNIDCECKNEMKKRGKAIAGYFKDRVGFAMVWQPDVIVGTVADDLRGISIKGHEFDIHSVDDLNHGRIQTVDIVKGAPISDICQVMAEIIGAESKFLRNSQSKEEYLSKWCLQSRFEQHYSFKL